MSDKHSSKIIPIILWSIGGILLMSIFVYASTVVTDTGITIDGKNVATSDQLVGLGVLNNYTFSSLAYASRGVGSNDIAFYNGAGTITSACAYDDANVGGINYLQIKIDGNLIFNKSVIQTAGNQKIICFNGNSQFTSSLNVSLLQGTGNSHSSSAQVSYYKS